MLGVLWFMSPLRFQTRFLLFNSSSIFHGQSLLSPQEAIGMITLSNILRDCRRQPSHPHTTILCRFSVSIFSLNTSSTMC